MFEQNTDENLNDRLAGDFRSLVYFFNSSSCDPAPRSSHLHRNDSRIPMQKTGTEMRQENLDLTDRPESNSDLESARLP